MCRRHVQVNELWASRDKAGGSIETFAKRASSKVNNYCENVSLRGNTLRCNISNSNMVEFICKRFATRIRSSFPWNCTECFFDRTDIGLGSHAMINQSNPEFERYICFFHRRITISWSSSGLHNPPTGRGLAPMSPPLSQQHRKVTEDRRRCGGGRWSGRGWWRQGGEGGSTRQFRPKAEDFSLLRWWLVGDMVVRWWLVVTLSPDD